MPQNSNFRLPRGHRFFQKNGSYGYGAKSRRGPPRVHLGASGVIGFSQKMEVTVMAPNHGWDHLGSILGPMGSHWVQKMGRNYKKLPCPKSDFSIILRSSIFPKKWKLRLWRQITEGTPLSPYWGQWGPIGSKKWVSTVKNYHAPKCTFSITPRSSTFCKKI